MEVFMLKFLEILKDVLSVAMAVMLCKICLNKLYRSKFSFFG